MTTQLVASFDEEQRQSAKVQLVVWVVPQDCNSHFDQWYYTWSSAKLLDRTVRQFKPHMPDVLWGQQIDFACGSTLAGSSGAAVTRTWAAQDRLFKSGTARARLFPVSLLSAGSWHHHQHVVIVHHHHSKHYAALPTLGRYPLGCSDHCWLIAGFPSAKAVATMLRTATPAFPTGTTAGPMSRSLGAAWLRLA